MNGSHLTPAESISQLVERGRIAQKTMETFTQAQVDELAAAIAWTFTSDQQLVEELATMSFQECGLGDIPSKIAKVNGKCRGVYYDVKHQKSVGIVEEIPEKGLVRIAKPVGVIASLVPSTQGEMHPILQAINTVKARDAIIFTPHPRAKKTTAKVCTLLREIMKRYGAPEDTFLCVESPSVEKTNELMKQCDLVIATGGGPMVKAAYSSGTPAYGVGAGNAIIVVDKTADLADAAEKIKVSKTFDLAAGCSCDNGLVIDAHIYDAMLAELKKVGAYVCTPEEKEKMQQALWPHWPHDHVLNRDIVATPAQNIAQIAGIEMPENTTMILVEEDQVGSVTPFAGEKLSLVITVYKSQSIDHAISIINANHAYSGAGHSCGIYTQTPEHVDQLALGTYTTRVVVNLPESATNTGSWVSGMPFTSSLGCGTWGGNSASENIALKHYLNNTWVIRSIENFQPSDEDLFAGFTPRT